VEITKDCRKKPYAGWKLAGDDTNPEVAT
jgi:hypothetical protein